MFWVLLSTFLSYNGGILARSPLHSIETRVIVDKHAFDSWKSIVDSSVTESEKDTVTKSAMTKYITSAFASLNSVYTELSKTGINIDARIVSIEFIKERVTNESEGTIERDDVIDELREWLSSQNYPSVDHTMLLTGLDITKDGLNSTVGVAALGEMCDPTNSLSAIELYRTGYLSLVMAHELGHSLSAEHDGENNTCTAGHYIMKNETDHDYASTENFRFSTCSLEYFKTFLDSGKGSCLTQTTAPQETSLPMGRMYTPDQICQMAQGNQSYACRQFYGPGAENDYDYLCLIVMCRNPGENSCKERTSADGFVCGKNKRCLLGECVPDNTVSTGTATDTCPLGDRPTPIAGFEAETCKQSIPAHPEYCYNHVNSLVCCESCPRVQTGPKGCEYGDKNENCSTIDRYQCYTNVSDVCCATCLKYHTGEAECPYGDHTPRCAGIKSYQCYNNIHLCCETCKNFKTNVTGCEYGDGASFCADLKRHECYSNFNVCCSTCRNFQTDDPGCAYGDRSADCAGLKRHLCYDNFNLCCATCKNYETRINDCKYGDKSPDCATLSPVDCPVNREVCCEKCL